MLRVIRVGALTRHHYPLIRSVAPTLIPPQSQPLNARLGRPARWSSSTPPTPPPLPTPGQSPQLPSEAPPPPPTPEEDEDVPVDPRVWPLALSSVMMGCAIGIVIPAIPAFSATLGLSVSQVGSLHSITGVSRLILQPPAAVLCDRWGRVPFLVWAPIMTSLINFSHVLCSSISQLLGLRLLLGAASAMQITASQMYASDISARQNRSRTMMPTVMANNLGFVMGPAIGGFVLDSYGVYAPFVLTGGLLLLTGLANWVKLTETRPIWLKEVAMRGKGGIYSQACGDWGRLSDMAGMKSILSLGVVHMSVVAGVQLTVLPLWASGELGMCASDIGFMYALFGIVTAVTSGPAAKMADKAGRKFVIVPGVIGAGCAIACMPSATSAQDVYMLVTLWGVGTATMNSGIVPYVMDLFPTEDRSNALSMNRTTGEIGWIAGGLIFGLIAQCTTMQFGFYAAGAAYGLTGILFALLAPATNAGRSPSRKSSKGDPKEQPR